MSKNEFVSIDEALKMLTEGIVDITFIKKTDGQVRTMHSTLNKKYMPYGEYKTIDSVIANSIISDGSRPLVVWDLYKSGWRSFYLNTTIEVQTSLIFGDTSEIVEDAIQERMGDSEEGLSEQSTEELIESVSSIFKQKMADIIQDAPEKAASFAMSKIKKIITNIVSQAMKR